VKPTADSYVSPEDYLALERRNEFKSEYINGEVHAMTGASRRHNLVAGNVFALLWSQLRGRQCEVYPAGMRVRIPTVNVYTYPGVTVVCGGPVFQDDYLDTLLNPILLVEVLSKSTAKHDRTVKFGYYRTLESLAEYLLIAQNEYHVEQYTKHPDGRWLLSDIRGLESSVGLTSVGCTLRLNEIYERVEL
jgi:Uma2 family endonuclease